MNFICATTRCDIEGFSPCSNHDLVSLVGAVQLLTRNNFGMTIDRANSTFYAYDGQTMKKNPDAFRSHRCGNSSMLGCQSRKTESRKVWKPTATATQLPKSVG